MDVSSLQSGWATCNVQDDSLSATSPSDSGLVFSIPFGVRSKIQDKITAMGNPIARIIIAMVGIRSGRFKGSTTLLTSSIITNAAEAYTVITYMTLRLFNSCQNWESLFGPDMGSGLGDDH